MSSLLLSVGLMFDKLFIYLLSLSSFQAYLFVFAILVACGLGLPLPEDIPLIACGYLISLSVMSPLEAFSVTFLGIMIGDSILFWIGRKWGLQLVSNHRYQLVSKRRIRRSKVYFKRYGIKIVFFARFLAGFRAVAFLLAGTLRMPYLSFLIYDGLAACLSIPIWIYLGFFLGQRFGNEVSTILGEIREYKHAADLFVLGLVLLILAKFGLAFLRQRRKRKVLTETRKTP